MKISDNTKLIVDSFRKLHSKSKEEVFLEGFQKRLEAQKSFSSIDAQINYLNKLGQKDIDLSSKRKQNKFLVKLRKITRNVNSRLFVESESLKSINNYYKYYKDKR